MPTSGTGSPTSAEPSALSIASVPFKRRFVVPTVVLAVLELVAVGYPVWAAFDLGGLGQGTLLRTALPVGIGGMVVWFGAVTAWLMPLWTAVAARRRGDKVGK